MPSDWRPLYPFAPHTLPLGGWRMNYVDEGQGEPLLMVHGNPTWSFYWRELILGLRNRYRTLAVDHIGCGLSDKPADFPYTLQAHIDNLAQFVEALDLSGVTLLAHDWGGAIGLGTVLRLPERFSRIVLFNTGAFPPPFVPLRIRVCRTPVLGKFAVQGLNLFARAALWMATEKPEKMTPAVQAGLLAPYDSWPHRRAIYQFVADIPLTRRHPTWRTLAEIEAGLTTLADKPIALVWGMKDWCFTPACLERFESHFPSAESHRLADAGHYVVQDAAPRVLEIVSQFLAAHSVGQVS